MKVIAFVPDMMDRSRFSGVDVSFVSSPAQLNDEADLVVADLGRPGVIDALRDIGTEKVGFFSHVDDEIRAQAVAAGVRVYARSAFFSRIVTILTKSDDSDVDTSE